MRNWYYLSFADHKLLGGAYVQSTNVKHAVIAAHALGINPGGEVLVIGPIEDSEMDAHVPSADRYRLLTPDEIRLT